MFTKEQRSTFPYWFAHWCAYQMTALNLGAWRFRYLFHDIWKPWLRLFLPYEKVQGIHRRHNRHHPQYRGGVFNIDYEAMILDWECSRFTKKASPRRAVSMVENEIKLLKERGANDNEVSFFRVQVAYTLRKFGLL